MKYRLTCDSLGISQNKDHFIAEGSTIRETITKMKRHERKKHHMKTEEIYNPQFLKKMRKKVKVV